MDELTWRSVIRVLIKVYNCHTPPTTLLGAYLGAYTAHTTLYSIYTNTQATELRKIHKNIGKIPEKSGDVIAPHSTLPPDRTSPTGPIPNSFLKYSTLGLGSGLVNKSAGMSRVGRCCTLIFPDSTVSLSQ